MADYLTQQRFKNIMGLNKPEPVTGAVATALNYAKKPLDYYAVNKNIPAIGGMSAADLLGLTSTQGLLQDFSEGKNITGDMRMFDAMGLLPVAAPAVKVAGRAGKAVGKEALRQMNEGTGILGKLTVDPTINIVPKDVAKNINMPVTLPQTEDFLSAVRGTPNASISPEGLSLKLQRFQKPEQELMESVRTGVFYLPEGSQQAKYYKGKGTMGGTYGGTQTITGETLYKNPLIAKGGTGGKAPEEAYKQLVGKNQFNSMQSDLMKVLQSKDKGSEAYMFLEKYAPDVADNAWNIVDNSKQGNQLRYALQESVFANEARNKGYDSIIGFSKGRGDKGNFISEVFDIRESHYPSPTGEFYMLPEFKGLLK